MKSTNISICVCTRKRKDGLQKLLDSFQKMQIPLNTKVRIVIIENDTQNYSEHIINEFLTKSKFEVNYYLETRPGVVYARNRSVAESGNCDFCCFTDDDQVVSENWLVELMKCQNEFDCDGVAGPTHPVFNKNVPQYIRKFHLPETFTYGTPVSHAYTGCLLVRKKTLEKISGPFEIGLNFTGGEDSLLTYQITNLGDIIRYNPDAIAYEIMPDSRTTIKYVIKRKYMISTTAFLITSITDKNFSWIKTCARLTMKFFLGLLILIPFLIFGREEKLKGLLKMINAIGGYAFILGRKPQFYK